MARFIAGCGPSRRSVVMSRIVSATPTAAVRGYSTVTKRKIILALLFGWLVGAIIHEAQAGPFLDLDIGTNLTHDHAYIPEQGYLISDENPVGQIRIGYQTEAYNLFGPVDVRVHGYFQHRSSIRTNLDGGFNLLMFGIRIE